MINSSAASVLPLPSRAPNDTWITIRRMEDYHDENENLPVEEEDGDNEEVHGPLLNPVYQKYMVSLMSFIHKVNYDRDTLYTEAERAAVTPNNIRQWMNKRAFGVRNPGPQARSTECRSTTLEVMKKAVSWYMPNRAAWDCVRGSGNPTRHEMLTK